MLSVVTKCTEPLVYNMVLFLIPLECGHDQVTSEVQILSLSEDWAYALSLRMMACQIQISSVLVGS